MSWRQNNYSNQPFNPHGGRNAFRGSDANDDDASGADRAASFRAMRSFTQSIECDDLPTAPELPPELDIDQIEGLKNSDTNDTIIEVIKPKKTDVDPQLGETQKYKMTVPGPGHSEQEQELHKSLIRAEDEDLDLEIEHAMSENTTDAKAPPSAFSRNIGNDTQSSKEQDIRREYNNVAVQRRRPTTPTSQCTIESFAFVGGQDPADVKPDEKIKVSIPSSRRRRSDMSYSDFCDNMSQQMPSQSKGKASGRTTPINNYDGDILEEDPAYKSKAPPHPVVHRRASMDWENFEEQKDRLQMENAVASSSKSNQSSSPEEDDQPTFSEEMQEERKKLRKKIHKAAVEDTSNKIEKNPEEAVEQSNSETTSEEISQEGVTTAQEVDTATHELDTAEHQVQAAVSEAETAEPEKEAAAVPETEAALAPESDVAAAQEGEASENQTYDPNAYPGYIWNYETQQWETDPNYVPTDSNYDYSQNQADQQYYENGQQSTEYNQYYAGYDQNNYDQSTTQYDYTTAAFHAGYDQATDSYGNTYNSNYDQNYDYSNYNQTGYDQTNYSSTTAGYDDQASYNQQTYPGYDSSYTGYDQNASNQQYDHNQSGNDQTSYNQAAETQDYNSSYQENGDNTDDYGTSTQYPDASQYNETAQYNKSTEHQNSTQPQDSTQYADTSNYQESNQNHYDYNSQYDYNQTSYNDPSGYKYSQDDQQAYSSDHQNYNNTEYSYSSSQNVPDRPEPPPFDVPDFVAPSWNEQQNNVEKPAEEITEKKEPPRPPPPSRPAPPKSSHVSDVSSTAEEESQQVQAAPPRPPPASKGPPQRPQAPHPANIPEKEEDAWAVFKKMTEKVSSVVKNTEEQLKTLSETTAANEIKDESYLADVGGEQGYVHNGTQREIQKRLEEQKNAKILKKKLKQQGKKVASPTFDPDEEDSMDRAAQELAAKLAAKMNLEMETEKTAPVIPPPPKEKKAEELERSDSVSAIPSHKKSSLKEAQQDSGGSLELPSHLITQQRDSIAPKGDLDPSDPVLSHPAWADFDATACLPPSESGFFSNKEPVVQQSDTQIDPFAPPDRSLIDDTYDPFAVAPVEDIVAAAKAKAVEVQQQCQGKDDVDFYAPGRQSPPLSSPTPEGGSPVSHRPEGFEDNFKCAAGDDGTPTPLYDEDDSQPLEDFIPKFAGEGWELMVRHPIKKKSFMVERCWKPCYVKLQDHVLVLYNSKTDSKPIQELHLQATYSLSDTTLQAYDIYGKIHTVKLQYVQYREKVGIRPGQISRLVDGHITKYGLPLEHSAQCNVLLKFGSLNAPELRSFVNTIEDILFRCSAKRDTKPLYKQDEVQVHCYDEYSAYVDKDGIVSDQKARVRLFCLAFVTGSPFLEIGLNDRRRQGKEIVRRKDILPMYTERWIRFENLEFHNTVDEDAFEKEQVIRLSPPDGCFFEIMRFRVRPPRNREKFLNIKTIMKIAGSKVEIRMEVMAAAEVERSKGGKSTRRQIPCEDVAIKFPIPEAWIYIFREERHWGVGSVHSKKLKPGKVQNLKDRLLGAVQSNEPNLIEVAIGEAKYEHVFRSLVWRIPRLPEKHHAAYKSHSLKCRFELSSFDLMPETFLPRCEVDFTMPLATVSNTVVRSVSVEQHEDSDRVEKFVRYVAKCQYKVEIDYVQCADLEVDTLDPTVNPEQAMSSVPELHQPAFEPTEVAEMHDGYRIDLPEQPERTDANDSSSDDDDDDKSHKMPIIQIDMKNYGY